MKQCHLSRSEYYLQYRKQSQKFIPASDNCAAITAMDISFNKRYAAVAERGGDKPVIAFTPTVLCEREKNINSSRYRMQSIS
jgi:hypothetical protein